eukprot:77476-Prymnesium_polylepis.1
MARSVTLAIVSPLACASKASPSLLLRRTWTAFPANVSPAPAPLAALQGKRNDASGASHAYACLGSAATAAAPPLVADHQAGRRAYGSSRCE